MQTSIQPGILIGTKNSFTRLTDRNNFWYGISFDISASSPACTRMGYMAYHASLPIQSLMKGCLVNDNATVNYYLDAADWTKRADGSASNLDGTDGQVMVEVPTHYYQTLFNGTIWEIRLSPYALKGYTKVTKFYYSAYEAAIKRSTLVLSSVINLTTDYRGGNNTSAWDAAVTSLLGKPATSISRTNFRTYANNRGTNWTLQTGEQYSALVWLFVVEYATRNSQAAVNGALDGSGYHQGGLGDGVTTAVSGTWNTFNAYNPFVPCGTSNSLGNGSGEVSYIAIDFGGVGVSQTFKVPRYRGVENLFGHIWKWLDGININHRNDAGVYTSPIWQRNTKTFVDDTSVNYTSAGNLPITSNYTKLMQDSGLIMPKTVGANAESWWCDYFYTSQNVAVSAWYAPYVGGRASAGPIAGFGSVYSFSGASVSGPAVGARLCCFGS